MGTLGNLLQRFGQRAGKKPAPQQMQSPAPAQPNTPMAQPGGYQTLDPSGRSALLQAMMARARGPSPMMPSGPAAPAVQTPTG